MRTQVALLCAATLVPVCCLSQDEPPGQSDSRETLGELIVTGEYPGPGLWKVTRPDNGHVLWLVAQPPLLPAEIAWRSKELEEVATTAQLMVLGGGFGIVPDGKLSIWRALTIAPSLLGIQKNPDGERLEDILPRDLVIEWRYLKAKLHWRDSSVEKWRPIAAAQALREQALRPFRRDPAQSVTSTLRRIAKERGIKTASATVYVKVPPAQMRTAVKDFKKLPLDDIECFRRTLKFVDVLSDVEVIKRRAKAWATGDLETLRGLPSVPEFATACNAAIASSQAATRFEVGDLATRMREIWLELIESSLEQNQVTLALLPIDDFLRADGRLADLRAKGYAVEEPQ
jgi:hypothetical protein